MSGAAPGAEVITFHSWCPPPIGAGTYRLRARQVIAGIYDEDDPLKSDLDFIVAAPRFGLPPADVYSVHPPKGREGSFTETLPHVIFTRRTLPWERTLRPGPRADSDTTPWLALLVLAADDFAEGTFPPVVSRPLGELINPQGGAGPDLAAPWAEGDEADDLCASLDLPGGLFREVAPREAELDRLAHVREVRTDAKETSSLIADGWFSVVVANRMPAPAPPGGPARENRIYLVSLEGHAAQLGNGGGAAPAFIRLAVLAHWSFNCAPAGHVAAAMEDLRAGPLAVPFEPGRRGEDPGDEAYVARACEMGYTALNHRTRAGETTVSWYRGPLTPVALAKEEDYVFRAAADDALRYSPRDGMFDVSYAAAYQLGRLLALQDRHFAAAMQDYRRRTRRKINEALDSAAAASLLGPAEPGAGEDALMRAYLGRFAAGDGGPTGWATEPPPIDEGQEGDGNTPPAALKLTRDVDLHVPAAVRGWLSRLTLLYRVPFVYLVPDERMLEPDTIRYFSVDPNWVKCLLEGACGVGRVSARDELTDKQLRHRFLDFALEGALTVRGGSVEAGDATPIGDGKKPQPDWPLTGFLMRSPLVEGWQGLEMRAWRDPARTASVDPLRIDRLAPDIMLCIFNGTAASIEIKQPPEGLHFGLTAKGDGYERSILRRLEAGTGTRVATDEPGTQIAGASPVPAQVRSRPRVIDIAALALELAKGLGRDAPLTSAEFGVEMVQSASRLLLPGEGSDTS